MAPMGSVEDLRGVGAGGPGADVNSLPSNLAANTPTTTHHNDSNYSRRSIGAPPPTILDTQQPDANDPIYQQAVLEVDAARAALAKQQQSLAKHEEFYRNSFGVDGLGRPYTSLKASSGKASSEKTRAIVQARIQMQERVATLKEKLEVATNEYGALREEMAKNKKAVHGLSKQEDQAEMNIANLRAFIQSMDESCDDQESVVRSLLQSIEIGVARHLDAKGVANATESQATKTDGVIKQVEAKLSEETSYGITLKREALNAQRGVARAMELQGDFENGFATTVSELQLLQEKQEMVNMQVAAATTTANLKRTELLQQQEEIRALRQTMAQHGDEVMQLSREELRGAEMQSKLNFATKADPVLGIMTELTALETNVKTAADVHAHGGGQWIPNYNPSGGPMIPLGGIPAGLGAAPGLPQRGAELMNTTTLSPWDAGVLPAVRGMLGELSDSKTPARPQSAATMADRVSRLTSAREELTAALQRL